MNTSTSTLLNRSFISACASNLLFFFSFYLLIPVLPLYLHDEMHAGKSVTGLILSSYTIATLFIRPISGVLVDSWQRKPLYMVCYFCFAAYFLGYLLAGTLILLALIRCTHGLVFGIATTSANTLAIDTLPPDKLGRGIGIYGTASSLAMALGPMAGLMLLGHFSFQAVFGIAFLSAFGAFLIGSTIRVEPRVRNVLPNEDRRLSFDQFFLVRGWPSALCIFMFAFLYGVLMNYLSFFARERHISANPGYFFCLLSAGLILSRFIAGRMIDNGYLCRMIIIGKLILIAAILPFILIPNERVFFGSAVFIGFGFGLIAPSYQTLFIRLASRERRGTANSTYLTAWDGGIGIAVLASGLMLEHTTLTDVFLLGTTLVVVSMLFFAAVGAPHFKRYRLS